MFYCTNKEKVDAIYQSLIPRNVSQIMRETYPDAVEDSSGRFHAPCDGYVCPLTERIFRAGEFLPMKETDGKIYSVEAKYDFDVIKYSGTKAQIEAVKNELRDQTNVLDANTSRFIGNIGDVIQVIVCVETVLTFDGMYGACFIHIMKNQKGDVIIYKGAKKLAERNTFIELKATIKALEERNRVHQTVIERPKVIK